jgi:hypothetical protein
MSSETKQALAPIKRFNEAFNRRDVNALWTYTFNTTQPDRGHMRGVDVFRVQDGLVAEKFSYVKSGEFVRNLGLQFPRM